MHTALGSDDISTTTPPADLSAFLYAELILLDYCFREDSTALFYIRGHPADVPSIM
jgi:hypothetical protein